MLKKIILLFLMLSVSVSSFATSRVEDLINEDRDSRLDEINRIVLKINSAEAELTTFRFELDRVQANSSKLDHDIFMRNTAGILAAVGFCTTLIYHKKHVTPSIFMLIGGYTLSTVSTIVMAIENKGVRLSKKEVSDLQLSIRNLELLIKAEKKDLEKEINILNQH